jgi:putative membrane protein
MSSTTTLLRRLLIVGLVLILVPFGMMLLITPMAGTWGGSHMWTGGMAPGTLGWLWPLLWLAIIVGIGYLLVSLLRGSDDQQTDPAIEELRAAYARGELSEEEFETRLERLRRDLAHTVKYRKLPLDRRPVGGRVGNRLQ